MRHAHKRCPDYSPAQCDTSGAYLYYTAEAICKTATSEFDYDDDDEKPTGYPTQAPTRGATPSPSFSKMPTPNSPTISQTPTLTPPTAVPTPAPTMAPHIPTVVPTSYPTNPDESAYCTVAKFKCSINPASTFPAVRKTTAQYVCVIFCSNARYLSTIYSSAVLWPVQRF